ncbi:MAG TPA: GNAT family N-acetyltransferase [Streptosporangiaceae bacterium]|jgi:GNAT superfamily N-acetyltransferase
MRIEPFDPVTDTEKVRACYELYAAGHEADDPGAPLMSWPAYRGQFGLVSADARREAWLVPGEEHGTVAGMYLLRMPVMENQHLGMTSIAVAPVRRRAGLGTALLHHAAGRLREHGRTVLSSEARQGSPGAAFAEAVGAKVGITDARRVLDLADIPDGHLAALRRRAEAAARGYSLLSWVGPTPEEHLEQVAAVSSALEDAPHVTGLTSEIFDASRIRMEDERAATRGLRSYTVVARCDQSGELAALSHLDVDPARPGWGYQELTAVTRPHRGHKLGLLVKLAMLDLLAEAEPDVQHIYTGNADGNTHMIAINAELGFRIQSHWSVWLLDLAHLPAPPS